MSLQGLRHICEFGWWSRMWVVQETLLSASAYIIVGQTMLSWDIVRQGAASLLHHANTCCRQLTADFDDRNYEKMIKDNIHVCAQIIQPFQRILTNTKNDLLAHLWTFRNRLASVRHDKVYGIMGLIKHEGSLLRPNYEEPFNILCRSVILEDIRLSNNLNALRGLRDDLKDNSDFSTWTTDWSDLDYWSEDRLRILNEIYRPMYHASLNHVPRVIMHDMPQYGEAALRVAGNVLDQVVHTTPFLRFHNDTAEHTDYIEIVTALKALHFCRTLSHRTSYITGGSFFNAFWKTLLAGCIIPYSARHDVGHNSPNTVDKTPRHSTRRDALWRTLLAGCINSYKWCHSPLHTSFGPDDKALQHATRRATTADLWSFMIWLMSISDGYFLAHKNDTADDVIESITTSPRQNPGANAPSSKGGTERMRDLDTVRTIRASVVRATSGRCMFITSKGYIGLGPHSLQVKDSVAILLGGSTPFALRPDQGKPKDVEHWKLIGDCYIHGWMDGELVRSEDTGLWGDVVLV